MARKPKAKKAISLDEVLYKDWTTFTKLLPKLDEEQLREALTRELGKSHRKEYVFRIHRKYNQVRYKREQREYGVIP